MLLWPDRLPRALTRLMLRAGVPLGAWMAEAGARRRGAAPRPLVLLRVDDYPHWSVGIDRFWAFHERLSGHRVSYLLAVTPFLAKDPAVADSEPRPLVADEWSRLAESVARGELEIALHGITHRTRGGRLASEFDGMPVQEARQGLAQGWGALAARGCRPIAFVPPFNRFPPSLWHALPSECGVLCLGPESLRDVPPLPTPAWSDDRCVVMSLPPFYGRARTILAALRRGRWLERAGVVLPITLHWTWEMDDPSAADELIATLAPFVVRWTAANQRESGRLSDDQ